VRVPLWARLLGFLLALQVVLLIAAAGAAGATLLGSQDQSAHTTRTISVRPLLELALKGVPSVDCPSVSAASPPCGSRSTRRLLDTRVRIVPGRAGEIVVEQDVRVRAAGPELARYFLEQASIREASTTGAVRLSASGWNGWDPRLIQGQNAVTVRVPANVSVLTPRGAPSNPGNPPNAPNEPNVPNAPNGGAGRPVEVPAGATSTGDAAAWQADVTVKGDVTGDVSVVGGTATIDGTVHGSVWVWNGTAVVAGHVGGNVSVSGGSLTIGPQATVGGEVTVWRPPAPVSAAGSVSGVVSVVSGGLQVARGARVGRGVTVWTPGSPVLIDGAVGGDVGVSRGDVEFGQASSLAGRVRIWNGGSCAGTPCERSR
jgi:hypothetical protein